MIEDGKPKHWPKMLAAPSTFQHNNEQILIKSLAEIRAMIVKYRRKVDQDWRIGHAQSDYIVNVVAGLIADVEAIDELFHQADKRVRPLEEKVKELQEELVEARRPFTAQMEMQNKTIIGLNAEVEKLRREVDKWKV